MNGKTGFAVAAVVILLAASMVPVVGSQHWIDIEKNGENEHRQPSVGAAEVQADAQMVEVPVEIHTRSGVRQITRELPIAEARALHSLLNETRDAMELLHGSHASSEQQQGAKEIIDTFLYQMKEYGLLGNLSIQRARELITGKTEGMRNDIEARKMELMTHSLSQYRWAVHPMCFFEAEGKVFGFHPWNCIPEFLRYWDGYYNLPLPLQLLALPLMTSFMLLNTIPHPTTIGFWIIEPGGMPYPHGHLSTYGGFGQLSTGEFRTGKAIAFTLGFTGIVLFGRLGIGFTLCTAFKQIE